MTIPANHPLQEAWRHPFIPSIARHGCITSRRVCRNACPLQLQITHVGGRGDGVGRASYTHQYRTAEHHVFVPATPPARWCSAIAWRSGCAVCREIHDPVCRTAGTGLRRFPACGGCTFQHWRDDAAIAWKAARWTGFWRVRVAPATRLDAHISPRHSRRRATFHIKRLAGGVVAGFLERSSNHIVTPAGCSVLRPELIHMLPRLAEIAERCFPVGLTIDTAASVLIAVSAFCCVALKAGMMVFWKCWQHGRTTQGWRGTWWLLRRADRRGCGPDHLWRRRHCLLAVSPSPRARGFLQATIEAEKVMQADIAGFAATAGVAGSDSLSISLQDAAAGAAASCGRDACSGGGIGQGRARRAESRCGCGRARGPAGHAAGNRHRPADRRTAAADMVIIDPRAMAAAQWQRLVDMPTARRWCMVSCNPASFARDAASLVSGGYDFTSLRMIDQFRFAAY